MVYNIIGVNIQMKIMDAYIWVLSGLRIVRMVAFGASGVTLSFYLTESGVSRSHNRYNPDRYFGRGRRFDRVDSEGR